MAVSSLVSTHALASEPRRPSNWLARPAPMGSREPVTAGLAKLIARVLETGLQVAMTDHLGHVLLVW